MFTFLTVIHRFSQTLNVTSVGRPLARSTRGIDMYEKSMTIRTTNVYSARRRSSKIQTERDTWKKSMNQVRRTSSVQTVRKHFLVNQAKHDTPKCVYQRPRNSILSRYIHEYFDVALKLNWMCGHACPPTFISKFHDANVSVYRCTLCHLYISIYIGRGQWFNIYICPWKHSLFIYIQV